MVKVLVIVPKDTAVVSMDGMERVKCTVEQVVNRNLVKCIEIISTKGRCGSKYGKY